MIWTCPKDKNHKKFIQADIVTYTEEDIINPRGEVVGHRDSEEIDRDDSDNVVCMHCGSKAKFQNPIPEFDI